MDKPNSKEKINIAIGVIAMSIFFVAFYLMLTRIDTFLRLKAFDDCGKLSRYETTDKNVRVYYPVLDIYNQCLEDKGLK
jgi:hypothetical protein